MDSLSAEVSSTLLEALKTMASLQEKHNGLVTYHFVRLDSQNRPNHFEFTEVYENEASWWGHSAHSDFTAAYCKGFAPKNKLQAVTYGYGARMQGK